METEIIFKNAGNSWTQEEDKQLNKLYNEDMLDIIEISKIHNRAPGAIISRLIKYNYISARELARGYITYKNSDLYKGIVSNNKDKKKTGCNCIELQNDVKQMKNEIKELVEMMKTVNKFKDA